MLFPQDVHDAIRRGQVTVAFRAWKRPTVRAGGTLHTPAGLLAIDELVPVAASEITLDDARAAGHESPADVVGSLHPGEGRTLYRIRFHRLGDDPRRALRADTELDGSATGAIAGQLARWDAASRTGPWTARLLQEIEQRPATPSRQLATALGIDQARLKQRVRQLKRLGLTESLDTGYRLSARGAAYVARRISPSGMPHPPPEPDAPGPPRTLA